MGQGCACSTSLTHGPVCPPNTPTLPHNTQVITMLPPHTTLVLLSATVPSMTLIHMLYYLIHR